MREWRNSREGRAAIARAHKEQEFRIAHPNWGPSSTLTALFKNIGDADDWTCTGCKRYVNPDDEDANYRCFCEQDGHEHLCTDCCPCPRSPPAQHVFVPSHAVALAALSATNTKRPASSKTSKKKKAKITHANSEEGRPQARASSSTRPSPPQPEHGLAYLLIHDRQPPARYSHLPTSSEVLGVFSSMEKAAAAAEGYATDTFDLAQIDVADWCEGFEPEETHDDGSQSALYVQVHIMNGRLHLHKKWHHVASGEAAAEASSFPTAGVRPIRQYPTAPTYRMICSGVSMAGLLAA